MKKLSFAALFAAFIVLFNFGCEKEDTEDDDKTTMCYEVNGNILSLNCYTNSVHACSEDGKNSLGTYLTWDECYNDMDAVLDNWKYNGVIAPGPGSNEGGGSSSGGGNNNGGGGSTGSNCDLSNYNGPNPPNDNNIYALCSAAYAYQCAGNESARAQTCVTYNQLQSSWVGPSPFPQCPYCN